MKNLSTSRKEVCLNLMCTIGSPTGCTWTRTTTAGGPIAVRAGRPTRELQNCSCRKFYGRAGTYVYGAKKMHLKLKETPEYQLTRVWYISAQINCSISPSCLPNPRGLDFNTLKFLFVSFSMK